MEDGHNVEHVKGMYIAAIKKLIAFGLILSMLQVSVVPITNKTVDAEEVGSEESYYRRTMDEDYTPTSALIVSTWQTPGGSDLVAFSIDTNSDGNQSLGVFVLYSHGNYSNDLWSHVTGTFMAPLFVVEFSDDGDGKFLLGGNDGDDGDDVISVLPLHADLDDHNDFYKQTGESDGTMTWLPRSGYETVYHELVNGLQDSTEIHLSAKTTDEIFEMKMHISNSIIRSEDLILSPNEIKLDYVIENHPYMSKYSILGLCSMVVSVNANWNDGLPEVYDGWRSKVEEDGLYFNLGNVSKGVGYFSWNKNAALDGLDTEVNHSTIAHVSSLEWSDGKATGFDLKYVAFTYGRASSVVHDRRLGFIFEGLPMDLGGLVRGNIGRFILSTFLFVGMIVCARWYRGITSVPKRVGCVTP